MGQINASLGQNGAPGTTDHAQRSPGTGRNLSLNAASVNDLHDENKKNNLKTMNCVKNRIDMLIEDCLNIKELPYEKRKDLNDIVPANQNTEVKAETKNADIKNDVREGQAVTVKAENNVEVDVNITTVETKHSDNVNGMNRQAPCQIAQDKVPENTTLCDKVEEVDSSLESNNDKQNVLQKKSVTTFQKFIDEVFDNSLHNMQDVEVDSSSNFLKLCTDSLKSDQEIQKGTPGPVVVEKAEVTIDKPSPQMEIPNNKKISLKDHIEKFLEASFREDMDSKTQKSISTPKNLNVHMLVNDMITRGLRITNPGSPAGQDDQASLQARLELEKDLMQNSSIKRSEMDNAEQTVVIIDDGDKDVLPVTNLKENKNQNFKVNGHLHPDIPPSKAQLQGGQKSYSRETLKAADTPSRSYNVQDRRDPFDPRFADPKFQDNRIDIVPHELNAHSKGEHQFDRRNIPKADPNVGPMPVAPHAVYQTRAQNPGPTSQYAMNSRGSPSSHHGNHQQNQAVMSGIHTGHHPDCKCPICLALPSKSTLQEHIEKPGQQRSPNYSTQRFSPSDRSGVSPMGGAGMYHGDQATGMIRMPFSSALPYGQTPYSPVQGKLVPQRPQITAPIERHYGRLATSSEHMNNVNMSSMHPGSLQDHFNQGQYLHNLRGDHYPPSEKYPRSVPENMMHQSKPLDRHVNSYRQANLPQKESSTHSQGMRHHADHDVPKIMKHVESLENESAPLDLTVKRSHAECEQQRQSSSHPSSQAGHTKLSPTLTFIKHLENSVDKYCQELFSPPSPTLIPRHSKAQVSSRPVSPSDRRSPMVGYSPLPSPHGILPQGLYPPLLQGRSLPSPHYSGGITMGQPLVDKSSQNARQSPGDLYGVNTAPSFANVTVQQMQPQPINQSQGSFLSPNLSQANYETAGKRNMTNVSKHEPIQNILGNHEANDILYLYCKVCSSTYGSLYGFRKHFRNQHGFEPRAEHTIIHTISGTKSALHVPVSVSTGIEVVRQGELKANMFNVKMDERLSESLKGHVMYNFDEAKRASISPQSSSSSLNKGGVKGEMYGKQKNIEQTVNMKEDGETKCLECPECGRTFQLNDFGSYKRHCRQHGQLKPFGCTDCQLSFTDQKGLKEHYKLHMKESQLSDGGSKSDSSSSVDAAKCVCPKCDMAFLSSTQFDTHMASVHQQTSQKVVQSEKSLCERNLKTDTTVHQLMDKSSRITVPEMPLKMTTTKNIVKQAAESMTVQVCADSSWDKAEDKADQKTRKSGEISTDFSDSGYSSSVSSNMSQQFSEDGSSHKNGKSEKNLHSEKSDMDNSENSEENFEVHYKHKKFFHQRKRSSSSSCNSQESIPSKVARIFESSSSGNLPVSSSTFPVKSVSCDSQSVDGKLTEPVKDKQEHLTDRLEVKDKQVHLTDRLEVKDKQVHLTDRLEKKIQETADVSNKNSNISMKSEARHNLPFVWDRTVRSRKTK